jgi:hypothetical protein
MNRTTGLRDDGLTVCARIVAAHVFRGLRGQSGIGRG